VLPFWWIKLYIKYPSTTKKLKPNYLPKLKLHSTASTSRVRSSANSAPDQPPTHRRPSARQICDILGDDNTLWCNRTVVWVLSLRLAVARSTPGRSTLCLKNVPHLTCYNLDIHDPIEIIFGTSVTAKVRNYLTYLVLQHYLAREETQKTAQWCFVRATVQLLQRSRLSFSCTMRPKSSKLNALITRFRESCSSLRMSCESKRLKKSSSDWMNSGNALIQRVKNAIFMFPILPGSAEAQVIWGGTVKRILIDYFIGKICAKKYQNPFTFVKVIASQRWDVFETRCTVTQRPWANCSRTFVSVLKHHNLVPV